MYTSSSSSEDEHDEEEEDEEEDDDDDEDVSLGLDRADTRNFGRGGDTGAAESPTLVTGSNKKIVFARSGSGSGSGCSESGACDPL